MTPAENTLTRVRTIPEVRRTDTESPVVIQRLNGIKAIRTPPHSFLLGSVIAIVGAGILVTGLADALARTGHAGSVLPLFFVGLIAIFVPCAWRLTAAGATRNERVSVSLILGVGLLVSYVLRSPLIFDGFDELIHGSNVSRMLDNHVLLVPNTVLPVSTYYPGLELLTSAIKLLTGLPVVLSQVVVLLAVRVVLILCVFLVVERICGSARAGGVGVLVYAANPEFYSFDAGYAYETLALALAAATVYLIITSIDEARHRRGSRAPTFADSMRQLMVPRSEELSPPLQKLRPIDVPTMREPPGPMERAQAIRVARDLGLALVCLVALVVTHHLTSWLTVGFLVLGAVMLYRTGQRVPARVVIAAAVVGVVAVAMWTSFVGHRIVTYLGPIFSGALSGIWSALGQGQGNRSLFQSSAGASHAPTWEMIAMLAAAAAWCLVLVVSLRAAIWGRTVRGGPLRWVPVIIAALYPVALLTRLSSGSSEVGGRAMSFIFFGMAVVVGGWLATRITADLRPHWRGAILAIASVCFLGSMIFGSGPDWSYVPGRYLVGADQRSVGSPSIAAAEWASTHIPAGTPVAADRVNGSLLADLGHVDPVTGISGQVNPSPLFFDPTIGRYELGLIRTGRIRYIVIDRRLVDGLPLFGTYVEPGESKTPTRLTQAELGKFDSVPGVRRVYDNGPIQVYDLSALLGTAPPVRSGQPARGATGTNFVVLLAALGAATIVFIRIRRRRDRWKVTDRGAVRWIVGAMVIGFVVAAAVVPRHVSSTAVGLGGVATLLVLGLVATWGARTDGAVPKRAGTSQLVADRRRSRRRQWAYAGAGLTVVGILLATLTAGQEWRPPDQLTLHAGASGQTTVTAQLATAATGARLEVVGPDQFVLSHPLQATSAAQTLVVPAAVAHGAFKVLLIAPGSSLSVSS
jgi:hypothetical protein